MQQIILGRTGLRVTRLGFGGIPIQRVDETQAVETVIHAVERGVNFLDTARGYTTSEHRIGLALKQTDKRVVLASKSPAKTADEVRRDVETSLKELQQDYIDLYQCHFVKSIEEYKEIISPGGAFEALSKLKEEGLIGHIGFTSHSLDTIERILDDDIFETVMVCFSFLEPAAREKIIPKATEKNVGIIAMKPFSGGAIESAEIALKYVLSCSNILVIPGVENRELFDRNFEIFQGNWELASSQHKEIEEIRKYHEKAFCRRCDYCHPCPEDVPIQMILGIRYVIKRFGDAFLKREPVEKGIERAGRCTECGQCIERCPYDLPIPDLIRENLKWLRGRRINL